MFIITLIIAIAALAVSAVDYLKYRKYDDSLRELESLKNQYKGLEERIADMKEDITFPNLEGVTYDEKSSTMTVKGNINAEGWISSGGKKEE